MTQTTREALAAAIGARVIVHRRRLGLSQADLAERLGVSTSQVSRIESGDQAITVARAHELAAALGTPVGRLISLSGVTL